jgi:hypothetical protein
MFAKVLFTGFAVAALALAQGGMGGGGGGGDTGGGMGTGSGMGRGGGDTGGGGGGGSPRAQKETKGDMMVNRLKLSKEQREEFNDILNTTAKDAQPIIQGVFQSRQNLANGILSGKSEAEIAALNKAIGDAQFQMTGVEVMAFKKVVALLKPNQVAKAPEAFDLMADIFLPQLGAGGGSGGRGRGGK